MAIDLYTGNEEPPLPAQSGMRLVRVDTRNGTRLRCCHCGQWAGGNYDADKSVWADLNGEPFKAYYHRLCAKQAAQQEIG